MMESLDLKILSKIKKCLALASSDNPHEAAAAMRQARALMDKHGVSASHIAMSDIGEASIKSVTMSRDKPAAWEMHLAGMVGKAFGCQMMIEKYTYDCGSPANDGLYVFVGLKHQAEIASYTASILIRKCKKARSNFISGQLSGLSALGKGMKKKTTHMADAFAQGYVAAISMLVTEFANPTEIDAAITQHIDAKSNGKKAESRKNEIGEHERLAAGAGMHAAAGESLYRPMSKNADALMIGI